MSERVSEYTILSHVKHFELIVCVNNRKTTTKYVFLFSICSIWYIIYICPQTYSIFMRDGKIWSFRLFVSACSRRTSAYLNVQRPFYFEKKNACDISSVEAM